MLMEEAMRNNLVALGENTRIDASVLVIPTEDDDRNYGLIEVGDSSVVRAGAILCSGVSIEKNSMIGHNCVVRARVKIGDEVVISHFVSIERDATIGSGTRVSAQTHLTGETYVGKNCHIGANIVTINDRNLERKTELKAPVFCDRSRVGSGSTIMANVTIGEGSLVGANSLVLSDVPAMATVFGSPAKVQSQ